MRLQQPFSRLANKFHVGRSKLLVLSGATSPATFGWFRPTIVLPDVCLEQDRSELEDILRHELHHVRRWDFVWNGFAVACRALVFFHPAAWYAVHRMQFDRELACDLAAVSDSPNRRAKYAECLIHFARLNSSPDSKNWGIDFAASSGHLKARIHSILAGSTRPSAWLAWSRIACGLALLAGFVVIEPSLGVLLSYAQQQIVAAVDTRDSRHPNPDGDRGQSNQERPVVDGFNPATGADLPVASQEDAAQPSDFSAPRIPDGSSSAQSVGGPQLLHRGSPASGNVAKQQTVLLTDTDASGQVGKAGDHDHQQALQQTATAAAVLKRLSSVDRH